MNAMMSHFTNATIPEEIRDEHAAQNMENVIENIAEEQERATKSQFKVFQFCNEVRSGSFNFDMK